METPSEAKKDLKTTYDTIADVWAHLKAMPLQEVVDFSKSVDRRGLVLDLGCSNCRNILPFLERDFRCVALDFSKGMIRKAKQFLSKKGLRANFVLADVGKMPFAQKSFDYLICTRVIHHIPTREARASTISEIGRITKPKGEILLSVYRRYFPRFLIDIFSNLSERKFEFGDTYKKWEYHGRVYMRFFHLFTVDEMAGELRRSGLKVRAISKGKENVVARCVV